MYTEQPTPSDLIHPMKSNSLYFSDSLPPNQTAQIECSAGRRPRTVAAPICSMPSIPKSRNYQNRPSNRYPNLRIHQRPVARRLDQARTIPNSRPPRLLRMWPQPTSFRCKALGERGRQDAGGLGGLFMAGEHETGKVRDPGEARGSGRPGRCRQARKRHLRGGATCDERRAFL